MFLGRFEWLADFARGLRKDSVGEAELIREIMLRGRTGSAASSGNRLIKAEIVGGMLVSMTALKVTSAYSSDNFLTC